MELVQAGVTAVTCKLNLELHLALGHRQIAHRARRTDSGTAPTAVWGAVGEPAIAHGVPSLLTDRFLVRHWMTSTHGYRAGYRTP